MTMPHHRVCALAVVAAVSLCVWGEQPTPAPASGPTLELTRHFEKALATRPAIEDRAWTFGVIADPHIYMYEWSDKRLAQRVREWAAAGCDFGVAVGDLGTGKSLRPDGDGHTRQMDKFAQTVKSVPGCPPVLVSMGNHEMDGDGKKAWLDALYPGVVPPVAGNGNDRSYYYSFDHRGCHFVSLDANRRSPDGKRRGGYFGQIPPDELDWLGKDLAANRGKLTFVFLHEPIEQIHYDTPYYLLKNRARLIDILRRHPDVKWIFHGHLHYDDHVKAWGLNIVHCGSQVVRVKGRSAELMKIARDGKLKAYPKPAFDLDAVLARRVARENGRMVYALAEDSLETSGRTCRLRKHVSLVRAEGGVKPTRGETMMKINMKLSERGKGSFTSLTRYLSTWDVLPIVEGMTFSYDVRCVDSVYDNIALDLRIVMPPGRERPKLVDANGILMQNVHQHHSPSLQGKADNAWYRREVDLTPLAGGWIDMVTLATIRPNGAPYPAGELNIYVDNIRLTWPDEKKKP